MDMFQKLDNSDNRKLHCRRASMPALKERVNYPGKVYPDFCIQNNMLMDKRVK